MRPFRVFNGAAVQQNCFVPVGLPFARGELQTTGSVLVVGEQKRLYPFKTLERWADGSVRRALIDHRVAVPPYMEQTFEYEASSEVSVGMPSYPDIAGALPIVTVNGTPIALANWTTTYSSRTRLEAKCVVTLGGLTICAWATLWSGQSFADFVLFVGNVDLVRPMPRPEPIWVNDLRIRFAGCMAFPTYGHVHAVQDLGGEWRLPVNDFIGDGQRWMTAFSLLFLGADQVATGQELLDSYANSVYEPIGLSEPSAEDETLAHGLYGRLREGVWPYLTMAEAPIDEFSREKWEVFGSWWVREGAPNDPWAGNGFWPLYGGQGGFHSGWGPTSSGRDGKALSPRGYHRWRSLLMTRQRAPMWWGAPLMPAFSVTHPRLGADWQWLAPTCHGWNSHPDPAHHEENVMLTLFQRFGEEWMRDALIHSGALACSSDPGSKTSFGEGRWMARVLERKVAAFLVGNDAVRAGVMANLIPWSASLKANMPILPGSSPPIYTLGFLMPGGQGYPTALLQQAGLPTNLPVIRFPFTEEQTLGAVSAAFELTGLTDLADAGVKIATTWEKMVNADGTLAQAMLPDGRVAGSFVSTWAIPGLLKARTYLPKFTALTRAANLHEATWLNNWNWDGANYCQA